MVAINFAAGAVVMYALRIGSRNEFTQVFLALVFGMIALTTVVAVVETQFKTVMLLNLFLFWLLWRKKGGESVGLSAFRVCRKNFTLMLGLQVLLFVCAYTGVGGQNILRPPDPDIFFYAEASRQMVESGFEDPTGDRTIFTEGLQKGCTPYHYGDLWLTVFSKKVAPSLTYLQATVLLSYPFLLFLTTLGFLALASDINPSLNRWSLCLAIGGIFIGGVYLPAFLNPLPRTGWFNLLTRLTTPVSSPKITIYFIFVLALTCLFLEGKRLRAIWCLLFSATLSVTALPAALGAAALFSGRGSSLEKEDRISLFCGSVAFGALFVLFYFAMGKQGGHAQPLVIDWSTGTNLAKAVLRGMGFFVLPNLVLVALPLSRVRHETKELFWLYFLILLVGAATWGMFYPDLNAPQLFWNIGVPIVCVSLAMGVLKLSLRHKVYAMLLWFSLIGMGILPDKNFVYFRSPSRVSTEFRESALNLFDLHSRPEVRVGVLENYPSKLSRSNVAYVSFLLDLGVELRAVDDRLRMVALSDASFPISQTNQVLAARQKADLESYPLLHYTKAFPGLGKEEGIALFIVHWRVPYLLTMEDDLVPEVVSKAVRHKVVDSATGLTLLEIDLQRLQSSLENQTPPGRSGSGKQNNSGEVEL